MADIEAIALDDAAAEVAALGTETLAVPTDVTSAAAVEELASAAFDTFGGAHLVCLNAGVFQAGVSWLRTEADWAWALDVNLWGPIHGVRSFVPRLIEQSDESHMVITSSMAGMLTVAYSGPYVVSKFAAAALAECAAHDLAPRRASSTSGCRAWYPVRSTRASGGPSGTAATSRTRRPPRRTTSSSPRRSSR